MTIAIAISVPDGIALAADTQTTWNQTITKAKQKNLVIGRRSRVELCRTPYLRNPASATGMVGVELMAA